MTEQEITSWLTVHAPLDRFVLIGEDDDNLSVLIGRGRNGLAILHIEQHEKEQAALAFLKRLGAPRYKTIAEYSAATGWDGIARVSPVDE